MVGCFDIGRHRLPDLASCLWWSVADPCLSRPFSFHCQERKQEDRTVVRVTVCVSSPDSSTCIEPGYDFGVFWRGDSTATDLRGRNPVHWSEGSWRLAGRARYRSGSDELVPHENGYSTPCRDVAFFRCHGL